MTQTLTLALKVFQLESRVPLFLYVGSVQVDEENTGVDSPCSGDHLQATKAIREVPHGPIVL